jgi:hypothetical protein
VEAVPGEHRRVRGERLPDHPADVGHPATCGLDDAGLALLQDAAGGLDGRPEGRRDERHRGHVRRRDHHDVGAARAQVGDRCGQGRGGRVRRPEARQVVGADDDESDVGAQRLGAPDLRRELRGLRARHRQDVQVDVESLGGQRGRGQPAEGVLGPAGARAVGDGVTEDDETKAGHEWCNADDATDVPTLNGPSRPGRAARRRPRRPRGSPRR